MSAQSISRARVAALTRSRSADDPEFLAARADLAAANIRAAIEKHLALAPPLTDEQAESLAAILKGSS
ncbi:hypothetical protein [Microbacterium sp. Bi121]|uniref:hypothetical protein n=1 Tax=Microbacterium sp. Bi121 TaxID=2822348 RepID=UPI001D34A17F|nr:hypothetical protein [Microbacterium sp. Bi121]CAH0207474.1 hypothetical protein SRABI121_02640 [Microbacterium sp. Bi121]